MKRNKQVHQRDITLETSGNGKREASCSSDLDCKMDSHCDLALRTCVCNMWSPRESFATAVFTITTEGDDGAPIYTDYIFVVGGFTYVNQKKCGDYACVGGYRKALNDVWHSTDGKTWTTEPYVVVFFRSIIHISIRPIQFHQIRYAQRGFQTSRWTWYRRDEKFHVDCGWTGK